MGKSAEEEEDEAEAALDLEDWTPVVEAVQPELVAVATDSSSRALLKLGISDDESITSQVFEDAVEWATARSAELVGKSWDGDDLIDNPDASMSILDSTREELRAAVAQAIEDGDGASELSERIQGLGAFSEARATVIARTEIVRAHNAGSIGAMRASGVVQRKAWSTSTEESVCDECEQNEADGDIDIDDTFSSGDDCPPAHPQCMCVIVSVIGEPEDEDDASEEDDEDENDAE